MFCQKCIHYDICLLGCPDFIESATKNGFCGKFSDSSLYVKLPCLPGKKLYYIDKDCSSCEKFQTISFSDHAACIEDDDFDLFDPIINCEECKKHLKIEATVCRNYSDIFNDKYTDLKEAEEELRKLKNEEV